MSFSHLVILGIILIIVIPPDKLPEVMRNIGRVFNDLRRSTAGVWDDLKKEAEIRPSDLMKQKAPPTPPSQSTAATPVTNLDEVVAEKSDESKS
ncbi:MAG: twin-arginine translocase TatA/TatE family subunit [Bdellovibrionota bacterium]